MLHHIKYKQDLDSLGLNLSRSVQEEIWRCVAFPGEGIALIAEDMEDICEARRFVDFERHPAEWVNCLDDGFLSALFVMNNSFTITLLLPKNIAPEAITKEMED